MVPSPPVRARLQPDRQTPRWQTSKRQLQGSRPGHGVLLIHRTEKHSDVPFAPQLGQWPANLKDRQQIRERRRIAPDRGIGYPRHHKQRERIMTGTIEQKLASLGIALHTPRSPVANYRPLRPQWQSAHRLRSGLLRAGRHPDRQGQTRRRIISGSRRRRRAGLCDQYAGAIEGRDRRPRQGRARNTSGRLYQLGAGFSRRTEW